MAIAIRNRLTDRNLFVITPTGALFSVEPDQQDRVIERLSRFIPAYAWSHVKSGDYFLVIPKYTETVRLVVLVTTGELLRLFAPTYPAALARLAQHGRVERELRGAA